MKIMNIITLLPMIWMLTFCSPNNNQSKDIDKNTETIHNDNTQKLMIYRLITLRPVINLLEM